MAGLRAALENLKEAGCRIVYLNGSFVTNKGHPERLRRLLGGCQCRSDGSGPRPPDLRSGEGYPEGQIHG